MITPTGDDLGLADPADLDEDVRHRGRGSTDAFDRGGHSVREVAADAPIGDLAGPSVVAGDDLRIDVARAEVVDDDCDALTVGPIEDLVEQSGLACPEVGADDCQLDHRSACRPEV